MNYQFNISEADFPVRIEESEEGKISVEIDGRPLVAEYIFVSENCLSIRVDGHSHEVYFYHQNNKYHVIVDGEEYEIVEGRGRAGKRGITPDERATLENKITAPMPGRILKILVKESQKVKKHQSLFIVESMKMENEVQSPKSGIVKTINFSENALVSVGDSVIELGEPGKQEDKKK